LKVFRVLNWQRFLGRPLPVSLHETPHRVTKPAVPFAPAVTGEMADRAVAPEIPERLAIDYSQRHGFVEIENRDQLHSRNGKFFQVRDFFY
jgi:hypothetical protein